jgi:membrane protein implicated in regulation of membrane protease activity
MRLVSTALVMMTIALMLLALMLLALMLLALMLLALMLLALMLLALMLLGPANAKSDDFRSELNKSAPNNSQTTRIEKRLRADARGRDGGLALRAGGGS